MTIEVGKTYCITIEDESEIIQSLKRTETSEHIVNRPLLGKVTQIHAFGFLFKLTDYPKVAELNILWNILKWFFPDENEETGGDKK